MITIPRVLLQRSMLAQLTGMVFFPSLCMSFNKSWCFVRRFPTHLAEVAPSLSRHSPVSSLMPGRILIHWKGEDVEGYSSQFRHLEFNGALSAVIQQQNSGSVLPIQFNNALSYKGGSIPELKLTTFNEAMQYIDITDTGFSLSTKTLKATAERCSLIHAVYQIISEGETYKELANLAMRNRGFNDMMPGGEHEHDTWCLRVRRYGEISGDPKEKRYSARARSMKLEKEALLALQPLLAEFGGRVNLRNPDCKIYVFDGLEGGKKVLARRMAEGPKQTSTMAPRTRLCITNTPLCPIAAFFMCNVAGVRNGYTMLDPFAGSCATLLATAMIAPRCRTVGIEIAHDGLVNRDDIRKDFATRGLPLPLSLLHGDSNDSTVRDEARRAIGNEPFDAIITDPPYGIRESKSSNTTSPLVDLFRAISNDRTAGKPLLRKGGRLVAFVPCRDGDELSECMPSDDQIAEAGLRIDEMREQPLNDKLSRWMVSYTCVG